MTLNEELDQLVEALPTVSPERKYWLVRTQAGSLYNSFRENHYVAIEHNDIPLSKLREFESKANRDLDFIQQQIKAEIVRINSNRAYESDSEVSMTDDEDLDLILFDEGPVTRRPGLKANQIFRFVYLMRRGDIVVIPSANSDLVSFGYIQDSDISFFSPEQLRKMGNEYILKKKVRWIKDVARADLDPYLFRLFLSHQAVNDVSRHADVIERSIGDFFILDEEAHLIIEVSTTEEISAKELFGLGFELMQEIDDFAEYAGLDISSSDLTTTINLNSPGKIDLKSKAKKTTIIAGLIVLIGGGGLKTKWADLSTEGVPGIIRTIDEYYTHAQERNMKQEIFSKYKDSLKIKDPEDLIRLLKQVSENKDLPK